MTTNSQRQQDAVIAQLNAEIAARDETVKSIAERGGYSYGSYRRYLSGERSIPMTVYWHTLELLKLDEAVFHARVKDRLENN
jgi:hypothetical protein